MLAAALAVTTAACSPKAPVASAVESGAGAHSSPTAQGTPEPADPSNLLIGGWKLVSETDNRNLPGVTCTVTDMSYTPTQVTKTDAGVLTTINVSYLATPAKVVTNAGLVNAASFKVLDKDTVQLDAILGCTYRRVA